MMKLKDIATKFINELAKHYDEDESKAIFFLTVDHHLEIKKSSYILKKDDSLTAEEAEKLLSVLHLLKKGKPIQYILGKAMFYGLTFIVNEAVLIPRPETEELVAWVTEKVNSFQFSVGSSQPTPHNLQPTTLLDIGTGSGCIAISLKKNLPQLDVAALDISSEALAIAKQNAILNKVEISFIEQNILQHSASMLDTRYSILVSNPPYITQNERKQMHENVLENEPHLALFVSNERPLIFYEAIADFALKNLTQNGLLFFEINEHLGRETVAMLADKGFVHIELRADMQGKNRMIGCCKS
ncbi:MAG: peptide chain release factor N(5)-glutamine methyltransferase [Chitinophagaceae bacterium]|nr:MAG: peptide chain release factor N(5)-glutamine methyltransferase [Chitinophagaceae bacterium]